MSGIGGIKSGYDKYTRIRAKTVLIFITTLLLKITTRLFFATTVLFFIMTVVIFLSTVHGISQQTRTLRGNGCRFRRKDGGLRRDTSSW